MTKQEFDIKVKKLFTEHKKFISQKNVREKQNNGIFTRYRYPVLTAKHTPVFWRYDLNYKTNPYPYGTDGNQRNI